MTPLPNNIFGIDVMGIVFLQLFNKSKLRNGTKTFLESKFFSVYGHIKKIRLYCSFKPSYHNR